MDWADIARTVWRSPSPWASMARAGLLPAAAVFRTGVALRNAAYGIGVLESRQLPAPSIGVGNLAIGGVGKSPIASFLATELSRRGLIPGILLRGYGDDEAAWHASACPGALVVADADRRRGAAEAVHGGAQILVLDDCLQRRDVAPDVLLAVLGAETSGWPRWSLPAGPWREGLSALGRVDAVLVSHKTAPAAEAAALAGRWAGRTRLGLGLAAALRLARFVPVHGGDAALPLDAVWERDVVAVCGIGEPDLFRGQLERLGARRVRLAAFGDHHAYGSGDVAAVRALASEAALIVTTAKDAVKLRSLWPAEAPPLWVAVLEVEMTSGGEHLARLLDRAAAAARTTPEPSAAKMPRSRSL